MYIVPLLQEALAATVPPQEIAGISDISKQLEGALHEGQIWGDAFGYKDEPAVDGDSTGDEDDVTDTAEETKATQELDGGGVYAELASMRIKLPSAYRRPLLAHPLMAEAVRMEEELRQAQANDALENLRAQLITSYAFRLDERTITGQVATTRAAGRRKVKWQAVEDAAAAYRRARRACRVLQTSPTSKVGRRLRETDVRPFKAYMSQDEPGSNATGPSWIWEELTFGDAVGAAGFDAFAEDSAYRSEPRIVLLTHVYQRLEYTGSAREPLRPAGRKSV